MWCAIYPRETLTNEPNTHALVGANKLLQQPHMPAIESALLAGSVFNLLRADVNFCSQVATTEQAAAQRGVSVAELTGTEAQWMGERAVDFFGPQFAATWGGSPEEKAEASRMAAYTEAQRRRLWGK